MMELFEIDSHSTPSFSVVLKGSRPSPHLSRQTTCMTAISGKRMAGWRVGCICSHGSLHFCARLTVS